MRLLTGYFLPGSFTFNIWFVGVSQLEALEIEPRASAADSRFLLAQSEARIRRD
jgi:hypothetical protein